jgi:hypothetical protein
MVFGIVVEAERDSAVYSTLIQRICPDVETVLPRVCQNVVGVRRQFVDWLKHFQWHAVHQIGKAIVIRDSDCRDSQSVEDELVRILDQSGFREQLRIPVHFYATRCMVETWLLADERAVNDVARRRGKRESAEPVDDPLEGDLQAKSRFVRMLSHVGLPATPPVYGEVAAATDLDHLQERCPYFRQFVDRVSDC